LIISHESRSANDLADGGVPADSDVVPVLRQVARVLAAILATVAERLVQGKATRDEDLRIKRRWCSATEHGGLGGIAMIEQYVLDLHDVHEMQAAVVGGKGAHLGGLLRIHGVRVPAGFCVTTDAFRRIMAETPPIDDRLDRLSRVNPDDRKAIRTLSAEIRRTIEGIAIPGDLAATITRALAQLGEQACTVPKPRTWP
jgi:pyruvate,water dikinase